VWDDAQPLRLWRLSGGLEEDLQPDAYSEVRFPRSNVLSERLKETARLKVLNRGLERSDTGENQDLCTSTRQRSIPHGCEEKEDDCVEDTDGGFVKVIW
jgi:hypothetical protein